MFHGIKGPQSGRTSRTIAEKMNDPKNFVADPEAGYDAKGGVPTEMTGAGQEYKERPMKAAGEAKPVDPSTPFTLQPKP
jgi:hypothetical protein